MKAIKAFSKMMPVFRHPRCLNCHGGLDIFSDQHPGASGLDEQDLTLLTRELRDSVSRQQCEDCHDNIRRMNSPSGKGGWMIPNPPVFFVDGAGAVKSDEKLPADEVDGADRQSLRVAHPGHHESIQFLEAAYQGDRALGAEELARLKLRGGTATREARHSSPSRPLSGSRF